MDKTSGRALVPYDGVDEYVFISYAHRDGARVRSLAANLAEKGYRIWYDEGIEVGADWPEKVAGRLADAALVLVFLSENFFRSQNCVREVHYAVDRRKPLVCVQLDGADPARVWKCSFRSRPGWLPTPGRPRTRCLGSWKRSAVCARA